MSERRTRVDTGEQPIAFPPANRRQITVDNTIYHDPRHPSAVTLVDAEPYPISMSDTP
jgi:hypothetical protein